MLNIEYLLSLLLKKISPPWEGREIFSADTWKLRYTKQTPTRYRKWITTPTTQLQPSKSLRYFRYNTKWLEVPSCVDAAGNHLQHLLWRYILSVFGYCINSCIYSMLRTRVLFRRTPCIIHTNTTRYVHLFNSATCFGRYIRKSTVLFCLLTV